MAKIHRIASEDPPPYRAGPGYSDNTADAVRAYLASLQPVDGCDLTDDKSYWNGRVLIERIALSAKGEDVPTLRLSVSECADVLRFIHCSQPVRRSAWWRDPPGKPSHLIGFIMVLQVLENSLRAVGRPS
ncbi:MAG: hypothetical protein ACLQFF_12565 [Steroidobacteraceae bacterium]|jgi:hypothetical protein